MHLSAHAPPPTVLVAAAMRVNERSTPWWATWAACAAARPPGTNQRRTLSRRLSCPGVHPLEAPLANVTRLLCTLVLYPLDDGGRMGQRTGDTHWLGRWQRLLPEAACAPRLPATAGGPTYPRSTCSRSPSPHSRVPGGNGLSTLEQLSRPPWNSLVDCARARAQPVRARGPIGRVPGNWRPRPRYSGGRAKHRALFDKGASRKATHTTDAIAPMAHGPRCARPARAGWWVENG